MVKNRKSNLSRKAESGKKNYSASDLNSLIFVATAAYNQWDHVLNPSTGMTLATVVICDFPPITFFGLSVKEAQSIERILQHIQGRRLKDRPFKCWNSMRSYLKNVNRASNRMITIEPVGVPDERIKNKVEIQGCTTGRNSMVGDSGRTSEKADLPVDSVRESSDGKHLCPHQNTLDIE